MEAELSLNKNINIRFANLNDLEAIVSILNQAISARINGLLQEESIESRTQWLQSFSQNNYPIYVAEINNKVVGYCYLSPYRAGRQAMSKIAEISYYIDYKHHKQGIASSLIQHAINDCTRIGKNSLLAVLLDINTPSISILEKFGFKKWGDFPNIIDLDGKICSQLIYGLKTS
ncbi:MAG: N-acetyltransferase [Bacteroidetes bacterium]|nr:MAG: N-acetyltransferase [Bacteroidota bacterium]